METRLRQHSGLIPVGVAIQAVEMNNEVMALWGGGRGGENTEQICTDVHLKLITFSCSGSLTTATKPCPACMPDICLK